MLYKIKLFLVLLLFVLLDSALAIKPGDIYFKAELDYSLNNIKLNSDKGGSLLFKNAKGLGAGVGLGYNFTSGVRTDLLFSFNPTKGYNKFNLGNNTTNSELKLQNYSLTLNAYYDFINSTHFIPYIMAGVGVNKSRFELFTNRFSSSIYDDNASLPFVSENSNKFVYQAGLGLGIEMTKGFFLDLGYKLGNNGEATLKGYKLVTNSNSSSASMATSDSNSTISAKPQLKHTVTATARFTF